MLGKIIVFISLSGAVIAKQRCDQQSIFQLFEQGNHVAVISCRELINPEIDPESAFLVGQALSKVGQVDESIGYFRKLVKFYPSGWIDADFGLIGAEIAFDLGKTNEALDLFLSALERNQVDLFIYTLGYEKASAVLVLLEKSVKEKVNSENIHKSIKLLRIKLREEKARIQENVEKQIQNQEEYTKIQVRSKEIEKIYHLKITAKRRIYLKNHGIKKKLIFAQENNSPGSLEFFYTANGSFLGCGKCDDKLCHPAYKFRFAAYPENATILSLKPAFKKTQTKIFFAGHNEPELGQDILNWILAVNQQETDYYVIGHFNALGSLEKTEVFRGDKKPFEIRRYYMRKDSLPTTATKKFNGCDDFAIYQPTGMAEEIFCLNPL